MGDNYYLHIMFIDGPCWIDQILCFLDSFLWFKEIFKFGTRKSQIFLETLEELKRKKTEGMHIPQPNPIIPSSCRIRDMFVTSVCRMAALCSFAVRDSLSTSICCLLSENWFVRVSNFVCKASNSVSFRDSSCFTWPIYRKNQVWECMLSNGKKAFKSIMEIASFQFSTTFPAISKVRHQARSSNLNKGIVNLKKACFCVCLKSFWGKETKAFLKENSTGRL